MRICTLLLLGSLALCLCLAAAAHPDKARIMDGEASHYYEDNWPFLVYLLNKTSQKPCGGVIWNTKTIVTAARCLADKEKRFIKPDDLIIYLTHGEKDMAERQRDREPQYEVKASEFIVHPQWNHTHAALPLNDIGLIRLATPIDFEHTHAKARCVCEHFDKSQRSNYRCKAMGWGVYLNTDRIKELGLKNGFSPDLYQTDELSIHDESLCRKEDHSTYDPKMHLCASGFGNETHKKQVQRISFGDDGAPLMCEYEDWFSSHNYTFTGIALPIKPDKKITRSFFLDVLSYRDWIMANAPDEDDELPIDSRITKSTSGHYQLVKQVFSTHRFHSLVRQNKVFWILGIGVAVVVFLGIAGTLLYLTLFKKSSSGSSKDTGAAQKKAGTAKQPGKRSRSQVSKGSNRSSKSKTSTAESAENKSKRTAKSAK